ncbi:hypothetical protein [Streptomyces sp. 8N616]|uniref:hypothetical protein n=1 Tax=Streptomyces sp. 8N616 TaxID=3457414 RepID=UPI003FD2DC9E
MPRMLQELPWQSPSWALAYQTLRSHIEGGNGRLKSVDAALTPERSASPVVASPRPSWQRSR